MTVRQIEKVCPVCESTFTVPPSLGDTVCCSRACADKRQASGQDRRACLHCGTEFTSPASRNKRYCSLDCARRGQRGKKRSKSNHIAKTCPACGKDFTVSPCNAHVIFCSQICWRTDVKGRPRDLSDESRARLTGRPRLSVDETRTCPVCSEEFTVPSYDPKVYCSKACYAGGRKGRPNPASRKIDKTCPVCESAFSVSPSLGRVTCCSTRCAAALKTGRLLQNVRQMTEGEAMWLAGLFDGEGSVVISQRKRPGGGSIRIMIANTVPALLERVREVTGVGSIIDVTPAEKNPRHLDAYDWQIGGVQALDLLRQMRPWLIVKAERADAALAGKSFPRQARWDRFYPPA